MGRGVGSELARKLGALTLSRAQPTVKVEGTDVLGVRADKENAGPSAPTPGLIYRNLEQGHVHPRAEEMAEERRIMNQKARLVAGMNAQAGSAVSVASVDSNTGRRQAQLGDDGVKPTPIPSVVPSRDATAMAKKAYSSVELIIRNLGEALQCLDAGLEFEPVDDEGQPVSIPTEDVVEENGDRREAPAGPRVFIISWLDHSERYGLGYAMSDGSVGVHFRDSTSMTLSALKGSFDYISTIRPRTTSTTSLAPPTSVPSQSAKDQLRRENFNLLPTEPGAGAGAGLEGIPRELAPKVKVMRFFENEIMERLYGADSPLTWVDEETTTGMVFVHKWYRCHQAIVFRLSNAAIQVSLQRDKRVKRGHEPPQCADRKTRLLFICSSTSTTTPRFS